MFVEKPTPILPPDILLEGCPTPEYLGTVYADIIEHAIEIKEALEKCDSDKTSLREWKEENSSKDTKETK